MNFHWQSHLVALRSRERSCAFQKANTTSLKNHPSENRNKTVGYLTGITAYNRLGLTNQVSNTLVIARNNMQPVQQRGGYRVKFVKRNIDFNQADTSLLQLLDAMQDIKKMPDATVDS